MTGDEGNKARLATAECNCDPYDDGAQVIHHRWCGEDGRAATVDRLFPQDVIRNLRDPRMQAWVGMPVTDKCDDEA